MPATVYRGHLAVGTVAFGSAVVLAGLFIVTASGAGREVLRLRRERWLLESDLRRRLAELGEAAQRDDERLASQRTGVFPAARSKPR